MKVAVVDWDLAYPMNSGKRLRTTNLMLSLADRHEITYVSRGDGNSDAGRTSREFLGDHGIATHYFHSPIPAKSGVGYPVRIAKNLLSRQPYAVDMHCDAAFRDAYRRYAGSQSFDLWQCEWTPYSTMLEGLNGADGSAVRRLAVAHNVDSLIWQRYAQTETRPAHRRYITSQYRRFERFESDAFRSADRVVAVSQPDANLMRQMFGIDHVDVVDNGVDVQKYGGVVRDPDPDNILFLGSLDWRPNQDAIALLIEKIFPLVRQKHPSAKLSIVGRRASESLLSAAAAADGVTVYGDVPDVLPYLSRAAVMTIPLRIGGGSRLKMIESLAAAVPVVATAVAAEGLDLRPAVDYVLADAPEAMADALSEALRDPTYVNQTAAEGQRRVADRYGWDRLGRQLEQSWSRCLTSTP